MFALYAQMHYNRITILNDEVRKMSMIPINADDFDQIVKENKETCIMVFHKESCSVCQSLAPVANKVAGEFDGQVKFYSLSVSDPEVLARFKEMKLLGVPQTVFIANGEKKLALPGNISAEIFRKETKKLLDTNKGFFGKLKSLF